MDHVGGLFETPMVIGTIVIVALLLMVIGVLVCVLTRWRVRRSSVDEAVMDALARMSKAAQDLRAGLTPEAADLAAPHLREMLECVAVGITDSDGSVLSWDGEATGHYRDLTKPIARAIGNHRKEHVRHDPDRCPQGTRCPMRSAVIVPMIADNAVAGVLIVVGGVDDKRLIRMAEEVAHFAATQLELASLEESRERLAQAEVRALRAQISPHFVYNALSTISSLVRTDPERARELLVEFAEFTRYSFRSSGLYTTLAEELRNIDRYLMLERARYGARLSVRLKVAPEVMPVVVPFLVLQPLVENAVKHGIAQKPGGGTVTVMAQDNGTEALISVEDDGVGMDADRLIADRADAHESGAHVGISNINQRMRMAFGNDYGLMAETAVGEGTKISLRVPKYARGVRPMLPDYAEHAAHAQSGGDESVGFQG